VQCNGSLDKTGDETLVFADLPSSERFPCHDRGGHQIREPTNIDIKLLEIFGTHD
jgi:hypothetical protein